MTQVNVYSKTQADAKFQQKPATAGTAGQVLTLDSNGNPIWGAGVTLDSAPTQNSTNGVTSGGVYAAIQTAQADVELEQWHVIINGEESLKTVAVSAGPTGATEAWTFHKTDGTTVTKNVVVRRMAFDWKKVDFLKIGGEDITSIEDEDGNIIWSGNDGTPVYMDTNFILFDNGKLIYYDVNKDYVWGYKVIAYTGVASFRSIGGRAWYITEDHDLYMKFDSSSADQYSTSTSVQILGSSAPDIRGELEFLKIAENVKEVLWANSSSSTRIAYLSLDDDLYVVKYENSVISPPTLAVPNVDRNRIYIYSTSAENSEFDNAYSPTEGVKIADPYIMWVITKTDDLYGMGSGGYGQQGNGSTGTVNDPTLRASNVMKFAGNAKVSWYITNDNLLYGCGYNNYNQQGDGTTTNVTTFTQRATSAVDVIVGGYSGSNVMYKSKSNTLYGCGYNSSTYPIISSSSSNVTTFSNMSASNVSQFGFFGSSGTWYINSSNSLYTRGYNSNYWQGTGNGTATTSFGVRASNVSRVKYGMSSSDRLYYFATNGNLYVAGSNGYYALGLGSTTTAMTFTLVGSGYTDVICDSYSTVFIKGSSVYFAGAPQPGYGSIQLALLADNVVKYGKNSYAIEALTDSGDVYILGADTNGYSGSGLSYSRTFSQSTKLLENVTYASDNFRALVKNDGTMWKTYPENGVAAIAQVPKYHPVPDGSISTMRFDSSIFVTAPSDCLTYDGALTGLDPVRSMNLLTDKSRRTEDWYMKEDGTSDNPLLNGCFYATFTSGGVLHEKLNPQDLSKRIATWDDTGKEWVAATGDSSIETENTMFCIPTLYLNTTSTSISLSKTKFGDDWNAYAHTIGNHTYQYLAIAVYLSFDDGSRAWSKSGVSCSSNIDKSTCRTHTKVNQVQNGYSMLWNFYQWNLMRIMSIFAMRSFDCAVVGLGGTTTTIQGACDGMGPFAGGGGPGAGPVKVFIENPWGLKCQYIDDTNSYFSSSSSYSGYRLYLGQNATATDGTSSKTEISVGATGSSIDTYDIHTDGRLWGLAKYKTNNQYSSNTGLCIGSSSYHKYVASDNTYPLYVSRAQTSGSDVDRGMSYITIGSSATYKASDVGARMAFVFDLA